MTVVLTATPSLWHLERRQGRMEGVVLTWCGRYGLVDPDGTPWKVCRKCERAMKQIGGK